MSGHSAILLENATATGAYVYFRGGQANLNVEGTFNGATVALQAKGPNGGNLAIANASLTASGVLQLALAPGEYRAVITGGPPAAVYARLSHVPEF